MNWETLPTWFWMVYYLFLLITLAVAIHSVLKKNKTSLSLATVAIIVSVPMISFIYSLERPSGMNEFEHLFHEIQRGTLWAILSAIGYVYLFVWWILFIRLRIQQSETD